MQRRHGGDGVGQPSFAEVGLGQPPLVLGEFGQDLLAAASEPKCLSRVMRGQGVLAEAELPVGEVRVQGQEQHRMRMPVEARVERRPEQVHRVMRLVPLDQDVRPQRCGQFAVRRDVVGERGFGGGHRPCPGIAPGEPREPQPGEPGPAVAADLLGPPGQPPHLRR
ncbi:hypothetical protein [Amycolatopsis sp. NPDC057786]|uniref:hypothetical protein n=1 Tax=Amycolatopsis sp. NPDC057786 TaxID=3346250 RepID=UPI0036713295